MQPYTRRSSPDPRKLLRKSKYPSPIPASLPEVLFGGCLSKPSSPPLKSNPSLPQASCWQASPTDGTRKSKKGETSEKKEPVAEVKLQEVKTMRTDPAINLRKCSIRDTKKERPVFRQQENITVNLLPFSLDTVLYSATLGDY